MIRHEATKLWEYRTTLQSGEALDEQAILLLRDVCDALGFNAEETTAVLGLEGMRRAEAIDRTPGKLTLSGELATVDLNLLGRADRPSSGRKN